MLIGADAVHRDRLAERHRAPRPKARRRARASRRSDPASFGDHRVDDVEDRADRADEPPTVALHGLDVQRGVVGRRLARDERREPDREAAEDSRRCRTWSRTAPTPRPDPVIE